MSDARFIQPDGRNMGLLPDLQYGQAHFNDPTDETVVDLLDGGFINVMHAFDIEFYFKFAPNGGIGGAPQMREQWKVGIVQNVIFEYVRYEYEGKNKDGKRNIFEKQFVNACLDSTATKSLPFYGEPVFIPGPSLDGVPSKKMVPLTTPVVDIWLTSKGYGSALNPADPSGVKITNEPSSVDIMDEPKFGGRTHLASGAMIKRADRIVSFQAWLVAIKGTQREVLASCEPFSLVSNLTFDDREKNKDYGGGTPDYKSSYHGTKGITNILRTNKQGTPAIGLTIGNGGRDPVFSGNSANDRGRSWLRENDLLPRR